MLVKTKRNQKNEEEKISFYDGLIDVNEVIFDNFNTYTVEKKIRSDINVTLSFNYKNGKYIFKVQNKLKDEKGIEIEAEFYEKESVYELYEILKNNKDADFRDILSLVLHKKPEKLDLSKWNYYRVNRSFLGKVKSIQEEKRLLFIEFIDKSKKVFVQGVIDGSNKDYELVTKDRLLKAEYVSLRNDLERLFLDPCFMFSECRRVFYKHQGGVKFDSFVY